MHNRKSKTSIKDALFDVEISFLQVEYAVRMLAYCESRQINIPRFIHRERVELITGDLIFPRVNFDTFDKLIPASKVSVSLAFGGTALALDKAWEVAGFPCNPNSEEEPIKLRMLVYMVRCAYAHGVTEPRWEVRNNYRRIIELNSLKEPLSLDLRKLNCQLFNFDELGGHKKWFEIRDASVQAIKDKLNNQ